MSYIVVVQDYGETYRYVHATLEDAKHYMEEVSLPCTLEIIDDMPENAGKRSTHGN